MPQRVVIVWLLIAAAATACAAVDPAIVSAWTRFREGRWDESIRGFEQARARAAEGSETHLHALYGLGMSYDLRRPEPDLELASGCFRRVVALAPRHDLAAWSLLAMARSAHLRAYDADVRAEVDAVMAGTPPSTGESVGEPQRFVEASRLYQECIDHFPDHPAGLEAMLHQLAIVVGAYDRPRTQQALERLAALRPRIASTPYEPWALTVASYAYLVVDEPQAKLTTALALLATYKAALDEAQSDIYVSNALWTAAAIAEFELGDFATARRLLRELIDEHPQDMRIYRAKLNLAKMDELEVNLRQELGRR
jgi:tetratricopeptide (TPR) repeat protein